MIKKRIYDFLTFMVVVIILYFVTIPYLNVVLASTLIFIYLYVSKGIKLTLDFSAPKNTFKAIYIAIGLALCIVFLSYFVFVHLIENITGQKLELGIFGQLKDNFNLYIFSLFIGWMIGGFLEEVIFRGFMISKFIEHFNHKTGAVIGILISSIIFGSLHSYQGITGQILIGLTGMVFAIIFVLRKRNLWLNILTHGFTNTISMTLLYFDLL